MSGRDPPLYCTLALIAMPRHQTYNKNERQAEEADKVEATPGVTVASLRRFRAALIGPTPDSRSDVDCAVREN